MWEARSQGGAARSAKVAPVWARWVLAGLAVLCAGCQLQLEIDIAFDRDGAGHLAVAVTADADLQARARAAGVDPLADLVAAGNQLADRGWRSADTTDEHGRRTVELSADFTGPRAFDQLAEQLALALSAPEVDLLAPLTLTVDDEQMVLTGAASLQPTEVVAELGLTPEQAVTLLRDEDAFTYVVGVDLPGAVLDTTADRQEGGTLRWTIEPGEEVTIHAVGERPDRPLWPLGLGALTGLVVAALVLRRFALVRRRPG